MFFSFNFKWLVLPKMSFIIMKMSYGSDQGFFLFMLKKKKLRCAYSRYHN